MTDFYLARQPICDKNTALIGYELVHHRNELNPGQIDLENRSSSQILISALLDIGLSEIVGDRLAFINITRDYIVGEIPFPLARKQIVLEVCEDILQGDDILFILRQFTLRNSHPISLDCFDFEWSNQDLLPISNYIKLDVKRLSEYELNQQLRALQTFTGKLVAINVNSYATFENCLSLGFDLFQGFYFCEPKILDVEPSQSSNQSRNLRLLSELQNPNINDSKLQALVAKDVTLTYRVLRYINSSKFHLARSVESIQQAISLLGLKPITKWITILVIARIEDKPEELLSLALIRAKMCESLAQHSKLNSDAGFLIGLFSILDALFDKDMPLITKELPLKEDIKSALEQKNGPLGDILGITIAYEQADWESDFLSSAKSGGILTTAYMGAIKWSQDVKAQLLRAV